MALYKILAPTSRLAGSAGDVVDIEDGPTMRSLVKARVVQRLPEPERVAPVEDVKKDKKKDRDG